ncbi:Tyrosine phosphatase family protein [Azospirillum sp. RU38E]|nr:Tyrosine phosphatase family protein [Azospirillum sp. RU38E]SNS12505.1 Tyrosine phosphatase family protein [Azospirillum sp. RU37A]
MGQGMQYEEPRMVYPARLLPEWASSNCRKALTARYLNMLFQDHAFIRMVHRNFHPLGGRMYRSSQPTPGQVADLAAMGIRTIINLRGRREGCGSYFFEVRACARLGIDLIDFRVRSRDAPYKEDLFAAREMWSRIRSPAVMHCKAGADRVGFMSTLYMFVVEGRPLAEAQQQLSWRFGHIRQAKTGILDYFFDSFARTGGRTVDEFYEWVDKEYDREQLKRDFLSRRWANLLTDKLLHRE